MLRQPRGPDSSNWATAKFCRPSYLVPTGRGSSLGATSIRFQILVQEVEMKNLFGIFLALMLIAIPASAQNRGGGGVRGVGGGHVPSRGPSPHPGPAPAAKAAPAPQQSRAPQEQSRPAPAEQARSYS